MKAFYVNYCPKGGGDVQQILVIARDLTQALNAAVVEIAGQGLILGISMVEGKVIFAAGCQAPTPSLWQNAR